MHPFLSHRNYLSERRRAEILPANASEISSGILRDAVDAVVRRWRRQRMIAALESLNDWTLADIGIARCDIPRLVEGFDDRELRMTPLARPACKEPGERAGCLPAS